jgi:hypothetical protein
MKSGLASVAGAVGSYNPTWFINLDQAASAYVRFLANICGDSLLLPFGFMVLYQIILVFLVLIID